MGRKNSVKPWPDCLPAVEILLHLVEATVSIGKQHDLISQMQDNWVLNRHFLCLPFVFFFKCKERLLCVRLSKLPVPCRSGARKRWNYKSGGWKWLAGGVVIKWAQDSLAQSEGELTAHGERCPTCRRLCLPARSPSPRSLCCTRCSRRVHVHTMTSSWLEVRPTASFVFNSLLFFFYAGPLNR